MMLTKRLNSFKRVNCSKIYASKINITEVLKSPKVKIAQIAPAVRVAIGEPLGGISISAKQLVTILKDMGFNYVFDTSFTADLTIIEEANELINRLVNGGKIPMFTSCCPGWIQLAEQSFPTIVDNISTCKSPQMMMGAIIKNYFANKINTLPEDIMMVSIMPCVRKQGEADRPEGDTTGRSRDVDLVITTNELALEIKEFINFNNIKFTNIHETEFDNPLGFSTGGAVIFGRTGGVMVAALRYVYNKFTGETLDKIEFHNEEDYNNIKSANIIIKRENDTPIELNVAIVVGLGDAKKIVKDILAGTCKKKFHFIEIMACAPLGCVSGGGQPPVGKDKKILENRKDALNKLDDNAVEKSAQENIYIEELYKDYLGEPGGHIAHKLLHKNDNHI